MKASFIVILQPQGVQQYTAHCYRELSGVANYVKGCFIPWHVDCQRLTYSHPQACITDYCNCSEAEKLGLKALRTWAFSDGQQWNAIQPQLGQLNETVLSQVQHSCQQCAQHSTAQPHHGSMYTHTAALLNSVFKGNLASLDTLAEVALQQMLPSGSKAVPSEGAGT